LAKERIYPSQRHQFLQSSLLHQFMKKNLMWSMLVWKTTRGIYACPANDNFHGNTSPLSSRDSYATAQVMYIPSSQHR